MKLSKCVTIVLMLLFSSNAFAQWTYNDFKPLKNLAGNWHFPKPPENAETGIIDPQNIHWANEDWLLINDSTLNGKSCLMPSEDTGLIQFLQISFRNNEIIFTVTDEKQNGGLPVYYKLKDITEDNFHFENIGEGHEIQSIKYQIRGKDRWMIEISCPLNNIKYWLSTRNS